MAFLEEDYLQETGKEKELSHRKVSALILFPPTAAARWQTGAASRRLPLAGPLTESQFRAQGADAEAVQGKREKWSGCLHL